MTTEALANITTLLARVAAPGAFCARRTASAEDLHIEVRGVGPLRFPISRTRARELCRIARPAPPLAERPRLARRPGVGFRSGC